MKHTLVVTLLIATTLVSVTPAGSSQTAAQQTASPSALPEISSKRLLNDLQVIHASTPQLGESMSIGLVTRYGSTYDPADKGGLAYLVSQMFGRAAQDKTAKDIQTELDLLGATLEVRCDWDGVRLLLRGQSSRFERSLLLLYQVMGEAVFNEADFNQVKEEILARIEKPEDPRLSARSAFERGLFQGTSYGRPLAGTKASLAKLTLGDVRYFYKRYFSPNEATLVIVSSAPVAAVLQKAARIWGVWVRADTVPFTFLPARAPSSRNIVLEDDTSSPAAQFVLGNLWPRREDPAYASGIVAARILQERMTKALPTSLLTVGFESRRMPGLFYIQGQSAADQAAAEVEKVLEVVENFTNSTVRPAEVSEAQKQLLEQTRKALGAADTLCAVLLDAELYRLGTNYVAGFADLVARVTPDSVKEAAKQWMFPGGVLIYVRGPSATMRGGLERLGSITLSSSLTP